MGYWGFRERAKFAAKDAFYSVLPRSVWPVVVPRIAPAANPFQPYMIATETIFIHVPKAAGSSITEGLYSAKGTGHRRIAEFAAYSPEMTARFRKIAFVRNPWDRLLSAHSYLSQGSTNRRDREFSSLLPKDFNTFVEALQEPRLRRQVMAYDHFRPQVYWVCMPGATGHAMDFLGRFEQMAEDAAKLGIDVPKRRSSAHPPYREAYTEKTRQIAADLYAADSALFGYSF